MARVCQAPERVPGAGAQKSPGVGIHSSAARIKLRFPRPDLQLVRALAERIGSGHRARARRRTRARPEALGRADGKRYSRFSKRDAISVHPAAGGSDPDATASGTFGNIARFGKSPAERSIQGAWTRAVGRYRSAGHGSSVRAKSLGSGVALCS